MWMPSFECAPGVQMVLPGDSFHSAATDPDECAQATLRFIQQAA
jgi:hypothetical protein